jgi:RNA recognition motif-containing protein
MNIYVGNVPRETSEAEIRSAFEAFGEVTTVTMIKEKYTNTFKGFAFIEMPKKDEAENAMQSMNGTMFNGRPLTVNQAKPKTENSGKPKGYGNRY